MKSRTLIVVIIAAGALAATGVVAYRLGVDRGMQTASAPAAATIANAQIDPATGKKILYWHDPMVPGQKFDKPGKSPFMDMDLVPVYADEAGEMKGGIAVSATAAPAPFTSTSFSGEVATPSWDTSVNIASTAYTWKCSESASMLFEKFTQPVAPAPLPFGQSESRAIAGWSVDAPRFLRLSLHAPSRAFLKSLDERNRFEPNA